MEDESTVIVKGQNPRQQPEEPEWDASGLDSPGDDVVEPHPGMCSMGLNCAETIRNEPKVPCRAVIRDEGGIIYDSYAGVEKRGRSSLTFDKPNYGIELRDEEGDNNAVDILGMGKEEDWILDGSWVDRSFMRNQLVFDLFSAFATERYAPEARYCTLSLDGKHHGIYRLVERPKRDGQRVDIQSDDKGQSFVIRQGTGGPLDFPLGNEAAWELTYPNQKQATDEQLLGVQQWLDDLAKALEARTDDEDEGVFGMLDEATVVDWVIIQEFSRNVDAYKLSVHFYKDVGGKGKLVPWDFDLAFGQPIVAPNAPEPEGAHESHGWVLERTPFIRDLLAVPGFARRIAERWRELRQSELSNDHVFARIDSYLDVLEPAIDENFERWPIKRAHHPYGPYSLYEVDDFADEVAHFRAWIEERLEWIDANVDHFADD